MLSVITGGVLALAGESLLEMVAVAQCALLCLFLGLSWTLSCLCILLPSRDLCFAIPLLVERAPGWAHTSWRD